MKRGDISLVVLGILSAFLILDLLSDGIIKTYVLITEDNIYFAFIASLLIISFALSYFVIGKRFNHLKIPLDWGFNEDKAENRGHDEEDPSHPCPTSSRSADEQDCPTEGGDEQDGNVDPDRRSPSQRRSQY